MVKKQVPIRFAKCNVTKLGWTFHVVNSESKCSAGERMKQELPHTYCSLITVSNVCDEL